MKQGLKNNELTVSKDIFKILSVTDKKLMIIDYIANNIDERSGIVLGTIDEISEYSNVSKSSTIKYINKLIKLNFLERLGNGIMRIKTP